MSEEFREIFRHSPAVIRIAESMEDGRKLLKKKIPGGMLGENLRKNPGRVSGAILGRIPVETLEFREETTGNFQVEALGELMNKAKPIKKIEKCLDKFARPQKKILGRCLNSGRCPLGISGRNIYKNPGDFSERVLEEVFERISGIIRKGIPGKVLKIKH